MALDRLARLVGRLHAEILEALGRGVVGAQLGAAPDQVDHLGAVGQQRRPLVERDLGDAERLHEVDQQAGQRLADGSRTDDVHDGA